MGVFGWHGTSTKDAVLNITKNNLDKNRRSGQVFGSGEYCAVDAGYPQKYGYWGSTSTLILFFILKDNSPCYKLNTHYVIDNPKESNEMYMVPILIATFDDQTPLIQEEMIDNVKEIPNQNKSIWKWHNDDGWKEYGEGQYIREESQKIIEKMYQNYKNEKNVSKFTLAFIRLNDKKSHNYEIDLQEMRQKNLRTGYIRKIIREDG